MKRLLIAAAILLSASYLCFGQVDSNTATFNFNHRQYEGDVDLNVSLYPCELAFSTLHGIRFSNTEDAGQPSFFIGINAGYQPWEQDFFVYYALHPRFYLPSFSNREYYLGLEIGANTGIAKLKSGNMFYDHKFYFAAQAGIAYFLTEKLALDVALKLQMVERLYTKGGIQCPVSVLSVGLRF